MFAVRNDPMPGGELALVHSTSLLILFLSISSTVLHSLVLPLISSSPSLLQKDLSPYFLSSVFYFALYLYFEYLI